MKNLVTSLLFFVIIVNSYAQKSKLIEIPFTMDRNLILIKADLDKNKSSSFIFDTGTEGIMLMDSVANSYKSIGTDTIVNQKGEFQGTLDKVLLPKLKFGKLTLTKKTGIKMPREMLLSKKAIGIIGMQTFVGYTITLDYKRSKLILSRHSLVANPNAIPITVDRLLEGKIKINEKEVLTHFDCGGAGYISIPKRWDSIYKLKSEPVLAGKGMTPMGEFEVYKADLEGKIEIGNYVLENPKVALITGDYFYSVNLGYGFFKEHLITIDTKNKLMEIKKI